MTEIVERFCVVCGMGSHRTDWANRTPACDKHSAAEITAALAKKTGVAGGQSATSKTIAPLPGGKTPAKGNTPPPPSQPPTTQAEQPSNPALDTDATT